MSLQQDGVGEPPELAEAGTAPAQPSSFQRWCEYVYRLFKERSRAGLSVVFNRFPCAVVAFVKQASPDMVALSKAVLMLVTWLSASFGPITLLIVIAASNSGAPWWGWILAVAWTVLFVLGPFAWGRRRIRDAVHVVGWLGRLVQKFYGGTHGGAARSKP